MTYTPPLKDIRFVMNELLDLERLLEFERFSHVDTDDVAGLLAEAGRFNAEVVAPLNRIGDEQPSSLDPAGNVISPLPDSKRRTGFIGRLAGPVSNSTRTMGAVACRGWSESPIKNSRPQRIWHSRSVRC